RFFERALSAATPAPETPAGVAAAFALADGELPKVAEELIEASYLEWARQLGRRTAELHAALADPADDAAFQPEPVSPLFLRSVYQSLRNQAARVWRRLSRRLKLLPPDVQTTAIEVLGLEDVVQQRFRSVMGRRWSGLRIRVHGDLHL